jgi:ribosomal protein L29
MNGKEVRALRDEEIKVELGRLRSKLFELRSQTVTEKVEDLSQFGKIRRDIARLLTESTARRHAAGGPGARKAARAKAKAKPRAGTRKKIKKKVTATSVKVGTKKTKGTKAKARGTKKSAKSASTK